ncbi:MAG: PTS sugar transporter subunit IIA [Erysipelotrichaceae bacterium]
MIGLIVMGHGNFATGMTSTLTLIGGEQESYACIDFVEGDAFENLQEKLSEVIESMKNCERILILCDLDGGSPYKAALMSIFNASNIDLISGINFPLLLELSLGRNYTENVDDFIDQAIKNSKESFKKFDKQRMNGL